MTSSSIAGYDSLGPAGKEREGIGERDREREGVCVFVCMYVCVNVYEREKVCVCVKWR